ncbi:inositol monophosphatase family protein [Speluncibacter jeojiensis]|uniref:inositol-phosphate phosphatase n=1 Tax=Speluncibacter jeojiensis TaxID=2710754 RepID=A0A9X4LY75_9ACTN|nr:inositol monophosphatase [Rhodococcus sp. D2-41]MDG3013525.1 inositol monophosphatase [Corynebacteriales bacterium D3-21]
MSPAIDPPEISGQIPTDLPADPGELLAVATGLLDAAAGRFRSGLGAPSAVPKGPNDFATEVDIELERRLGGELLERTGIAVHGEEFGGPDVGTGTVWLLDPVDGTVNYSAGLPLAGMLLALVHNGIPVLGLTWLPLVGRTYAAVLGGPVLGNGEPLPRLDDGRLRESIIAMGTFNIDGRGRYPGRYRLAALTELSRSVRRLRMHGSIGADLAFTAGGALGGAIAFGQNPWDSAAGVALVRAAGGVATDLAGRPWRAGSPSVLAAAPGVHAELLKIFTELGEPASYSPDRTETDGSLT